MTCCAQQCCDMSVEMKSIVFDRLAVTFKCWANNVAMGCVVMLRCFGRGLNDHIKHFFRNFVQGRRYTFGQPIASTVQVRMVTLMTDEDKSI